MAVFTAIGGAILGGLGVTGATALGTAAVGVSAVGATAGVVSTVKSVKAAEASAAATQQAVAVQVQQQQQQVAQQRRQSIRRSIIARSQLRQRAQAAGLGGSSALGGGIASISSQLGANLGFGSMMSGLSGAYTSLTGQANYLSSQSQMFGTIAGLGFGVARQASGFFGPMSMGGGQEPLPYTMDDGFGVG
jgi:hypothetical protein